MLLRQLCQYKGTLYTHQKAALVTQFCKIVQLIAKATQAVQRNILNLKTNKIVYKEL